MSRYNFTPEQQQFICDNHNLIYAFLKLENLPIDDYYDVVVMGFLSATEAYFQLPNRLQHKFSPIAIKHMRRCMLDERRRRGNVEVISFESLRGSDLSGYNPAMQDQELEWLWQELAQRLPHTQLLIIRMKADGYSVRDIARKNAMPMRSVRELLDSAQDTVLAVCYGI